MSIPAHLYHIAASEARKHNAARTLRLRKIGGQNARRESDIDAHKRRFVAWLFGQK